MGHTDTKKIYLLFIWKPNLTGFLFCFVCFSCYIWYLREHGIWQKMRRVLFRLCCASFVLLRLTPEHKRQKRCVAPQQRTWSSDMDSRNGKGAQSEEGVGLGGPEQPCPGLCGPHGKLTQGVTTWEGSSQTLHTLCVVSSLRGGEGFGILASVLSPVKQ